MTNHEGNLFNFLYPMVYDIRKRLAKAFPVNSPNTDWYKYTGLCNMSISILEKELQIYNDAYGTNFQLQVIHGEQAHHPRIESRYWKYQHTWCKVSNDTATLYVDPTSSQFQILYDDIPDYYISPEKPKWYLPDRFNWRFNKSNGVIFEFFQFHIWAKVSDIIHKMVRRR